MRVDFLGQADEPRLESVQPGFPGKVVGIERYAMAPYSRTRIERHKSERLGCRRLDDFPRVDTQVIAELGELVHKRDVNGSESILEQLGALGNAGARDLMDPLHNRLVERRSHFGR